MNGGGVVFTWSVMQFDKESHKLLPLKSPICDNHFIRTLAVYIIIFRILLSRISTGYGCVHIIIIEIKWNIKPSKDKTA